MRWNEFKSSVELREYFVDFGKRLRANEIQLGRKHYAQYLALGVWQAIACGYDKVAAAEIGVYRGDGLLDLCKAAEHFRNQLGIEINVYGFDNTTGLPPSMGYKDHPELWSHGDFKMPDPAALTAKLPSFAKLIVGDVRDTMMDFEKEMDGARLGFVAVDVDFYSSSKPALKIFNYDRSRYLPVVPVYFDDVLKVITYNQWCGEEAAIREFNYENEVRKIQQFQHQPLFLCHVLDHPIRTGEEKLRRGFTLHIFPV